MKIAPLAEVKAQFSRYVEESKHGPIIVTKNGRPVAVIVGAPQRRGLGAIGAGPYTAVSPTSGGCRGAHPEHWRHEARRFLGRRCGREDAVNHPDITTIHHIGEHEGTRYIAMELIEGVPREP